MSTILNEQTPIEECNGLGLHNELAMNSDHDTIDIIADTSTPTYSQLTEDLANLVNYTEPNANDEFIGSGNDTQSDLSKTIASPCLVCSGITSKKDRTLECSQCKELVHFKCSKLPAYMLYSLKVKYKSRKYTCYKCVETPIDICEEYETNGEKSTQNEIFQDIEATLSEISNAKEKIDLNAFTAKVNEMVTEAKSSVLRLENKFQNLENSIDNKLETWKLEAINKIHGNISMVDGD